MKKLLIPLLTPALIILFIVCVACKKEQTVPENHPPFVDFALSSTDTTTTTLVKTVQANFDTLYTYTTIQTITHKYVAPVVNLTVKPTVFVTSAPVVAQSGKTYKGLNIKGGTTSGIIIGPGIHDVTILSCFIHDCATDNGGIYIEKGAYNITVRNNIIQSSGRGVNNVSGAQNIVVVGNYFLNIQSITGSGAGGGSDIQFNTTTGPGQRVDSNYIWHQSPNAAIGDCLSFYHCTGTAASYMSMKHNVVLGGSTYYKGKSAGVVGDEWGSYQDCEYNIAVNSGMEGWQVQGGTYIICSNNVAFSDGSNPVANVGYAYGSYAGVASYNVTMANNRSNWLNKYKQVSDFWFDSKTVNQPAGWSTNKHDGTITIKILPNPLF